jgi:hypothetical protein
MADDKKVMKWRTTRKGHRVGINSTGVIVKGHPKVVGKNIADLRESTGELLERLTKIGDPLVRAKNAYDLATYVRNFAGELAYRFVNKRDPYGEMLATFPEVKKAGNVMIKAMENFSDAVFKTEKFIDITPEVRGRLGEDTLAEAISLSGVQASLERVIDKAKKLAGRFDRTVMAAQLKNTLSKAADDLDGIASHIREDVLDETAQPKLNKYDPGSLLGWVVYLLDKYHLDDAAQEVRKVSKDVARAWQERER